MANTENVTIALDKAHDAGDLTAAIVIGKDTNGKIAFYTHDVDRERMIVLLERARNALVRSLDN